MWPFATASAAPTGIIWCISLPEGSGQFMPKQAAHVQRSGPGSAFLCKGLKNMLNILQLFSSYSEGRGLCGLPNIEFIVLYHSVSQKKSEIFDKDLRMTEL